MSTSLFGEARYNIAPSQQAPVIANVEGGNRIELFQWGLKSLVPKAEHQSELSPNSASLRRQCAMRV